MKKARMAVLPAYVFQSNHFARVDMQITFQERQLLKKLPVSQSSGQRKDLCFFPPIDYFPPGSYCRGMKTHTGYWESCKSTKYIGVFWESMNRFTMSVILSESQFTHLQITGMRADGA